MQEANWENVIRVTKVHQGIGEEEQGLERDRTKYEGRAVSGWQSTAWVRKKLGTGPMTATTRPIGEDMQIERDVDKWTERGEMWAETETVKWPDRIHGGKERDRHYRAISDVPEKEK